MNAILKKILTTAEDVATVSVSTAIPGTGPLITGVRKLVDKDHTNNAEAVIDLETGLIGTLQSLKGSEVIDPVLLAQGIADAEKAFDEIKRAIK